MCTEKAWEHAGLHCEVRIMTLGFRCGYVAVDEQHPLYGVHYNDIPLEIHSLVNGGLTYSKQEGDNWVFGFDFNHSWDNQDPDLINDYNRDYTEWKLNNPYELGRVPTFDVAIKDCESLAEELKRFNSFRWRIKFWLRGLFNKERE